MMEAHSWEGKNESGKGFSPWNKDGKSCGECEKKKKSSIAVN